MCYQRVLWDDRLTTNRLHSEEGWREIAGNIGRPGRPDRSDGSQLRFGGGKPWVTEA